MFSICFCTILTSLLVYVVINLFILSKKNILKNFKQVVKVKTKLKFSKYKKLLFFDSINKKNIIQDFILYETFLVGKKVDNFNLISEIYSSNKSLKNIYAVFVENQSQVNNYLELIPIFYNLKNNFNISFVFLCKNKFVYNVCNDNIKFNPFFVFSLETISYKMCAYINKINKNIIFNKIIQKYFKKKNIKQNIIDYLSNCFNNTKYDFEMNDVFMNHNLKMPLKISNKKYFLQQEYKSKTISITDKIIKYGGMNHLINFVNNKRDGFIYSICFHLETEIQIYSVINKRNKIILSYYDFNKRNQQIELNLNTNVFVHDCIVKNYLDNGTIKSCFIVNLKLNKSGEYYIKNVTNNIELENLEEAILKIEEIHNSFYINYNLEISNFIKNFVIPKIIKNLVSKQRYYYINYLNLIANIKLKLEDKNILPQKFNINILDLIYNFDEMKVNLMLKKKQIDPCYFLYIVYKMKEFNSFAKLNNKDFSLIS